MIYISTLLAIISLQLAAPSYATEPAPRAAAPDGKLLERPHVMMRTDKAGKVVIYMDDDGQYRQVNSAAVTSMALEFMKKAKEIVCDLSIRPESVDLFVGVITLTWNTDTLCDSK